MEKLTIKDIAKASGVSTASVSRVLNDEGNTSQELKDKVMSVVRELNYQPNAVARSLKLKHTHTIGVIIPDISNSYFMKISKGIESIISEQDYSLIFASSDEDSEKEEKLLKTFIEKRVDSVVIATAGGNDEQILNINNFGTPVILVDRELKVTTKDLSFVVEDNVKSAYELTKSVLDKGHTSIGVINGNLQVSTGFERFQGFIKALNEYGMFQNKDLIYNGKFIEEDGVNAVKKFMSLEEKPTALISFNNTMTLGVIFELVKQDIELSDRLYLASYGETKEVKLLRNYKIVYVEQSPYEMGVEVGRILLEKLQFPDVKNKEYIFNPKIINTFENG